MSKHQDDIKKYCSDITKKVISSNIWVKKAIKRYINDLERSKEPDFPYYYDAEAADEVMDFAESLIIPDMPGEDKHLVLLPWMKFIYGNLFGWRLKHSPTTRRFRSGYAEVARKNSKTTSLLFPIILWDFLTTDSAESYFVSADGPQSEKSFKELVYIVNSDPYLKEQISKTVSAITLNHSRIAFFSADTGALDSYKNSLSIIDEFHDYGNDRAVTAFKYGGRARENNLVFIITSAGNSIGGPCYQENEKCKKILTGTLTDETYFGIIYSYDEEDDWKDPKNFIKANPSYGTILKPEILLNDLNDALATPSHQPDFKSKTCGIWSNSTTSWIPLSMWQSVMVECDEEVLLGRECFGGFDLSSVSDFTAYTLYFDIDGRKVAKHRFYIPESEVGDKYKRENINIVKWISDGIVTVIPGTTVDYEYLYRDILADSKKYNIKELAYDGWNATFLVNKINENIPGITTIQFGQGLKEMNAATKCFESDVKEKRIVDNNPVMAWMATNATIKIDPNGNYKPLKENKSSTRRIDGVITSIMANWLLETERQRTVRYTGDDLVSLI